MPTATKSKSVFEHLAELAGESRRIREQLAGDTALANDLEVRINDAHASILRASADPGEVAAQVAEFEAEKATLEARIAAVPAALRSIDEEFARVREAGQAAFEQVCADKETAAYARKEELVTALKAYRRSLDELQNADLEAKLTPKSPRPEWPILKRYVRVGPKKIDLWQHLEETARLIGSDPRNIPAVPTPEAQSVIDNAAAREERQREAHERGLKAQRA
jgi:uncharacterized membrane protein YccC